MASEVAKGLRDRRLNAWSQAKEVLESAENRSMTAEETQKYDAAMAEVDTLDARLKTVLDSEQRSLEADEAYNSIAGRQQDRTPQGDAREQELRSFLATKPGEAGYKRELEIVRASNSALNLRTLGSGSAANATGSNIVPVDFYDQLIAYLIEVSGILQTGPTVLRTSGGEQINIPMVSAHTTAGGPILQSNQIPASEPTFTQASLGATKFGTLIPVARELVDDTSVDLLGYLAMSAGRAIGNAFGSALVNGGAGVTGGLVPSITQFVTGASAADGNGVLAGGPSYSNLIDLEYSVIAPYRQSRNTYWLAKDQTIGALRKLVDGNGRPLWEPSPQPGVPDMLLGKPLVADPFMPGVGAASANKSIVFGDFSQYFVRLVGGLRFERSDDFHFDTDVVTFRAVLRGDGNLIDTHALSALKGA